MALTVTQPFADHTVGEVITDSNLIAAILASDNSSFVVRTADPAPDDTGKPGKTA